MTKRNSTDRPRRQKYRLRIQQFAALKSSVEQNGIIRKGHSSRVGSEHNVTKLFIPSSTYSSTTSSDATVPINSECRVLYPGWTGFSVRKCACDSSLELSQRDCDDDSWIRMMMVKINCGFSDDDTIRFDCTTDNDDCRCLSCSCYAASLLHNTIKMVLLRHYHQYHHH